MGGWVGGKEEAAKESIYLLRRETGDASRSFFGFLCVRSDGLVLLFLLVGGWEEGDGL